MEHAAYDHVQARRRMVADQIRARGISDACVLRALETVPRHLFVPDDLGHQAHADHPLSIGHAQTISQPYIVGFMTEALDVHAEHKVLEIGTGSGYQTAILGQLAREVYSLEIVAPLAASARATLSALGYTNVHTRAGNGYQGWPEQAPFDRIMVTAAPEKVPATLVDQLKIDGIMAVPVGTGIQELQILRRTARGLDLLQTLPVRFVPMTGRE